MVAGQLRSNGSAPGSPEGCRGALPFSGAGATDKKHAAGRAGYVLMHIMDECFLVVIGHDNVLGPGAVILHLVANLPVGLSDSKDPTCRKAYPRCVTQKGSWPHPGNVIMCVDGEQDMVSRVPADIYADLVQAARKLGVTAEGFFLGRDDWDVLLLAAGSPAGVSLPDEATTRDTLYD